MTPEDLSDDLFFGGRLRLLQPRKGHRFGSDAALLVAAARSRLAPETRAADLGSGVGSVGLALAAAGAAYVALVEIDPAIAGCAEENARRNGLADRVTAVCADVAEVGRPSGPAALTAGAFDLVATNPPFDGAARFRASPDAGKARAHADGGGVIEAWVKAAARLLAPGGSLAMIHRPEAIGELLAALDGRFGDVRVKPVHPRVDAPASRILLVARKGRRGALAFLPPLVLHEPGGAFTAEADAAQRGEAALDMD